MSNDIKISNLDSELARLWKLQSKINSLVSDGKRDAKVIADALQVHLEKNEPRFQVWTYVMVGRYQFWTEIHAALKEMGCPIGGMVFRTISHEDFEIAERLIETPVVRVTNAELGLVGAMRADVVSRAAEFGLEPCPLDLAPILRLQYKGQPAGEELRVCSRALTPTPADYELYRDDNNRYWITQAEHSPDKIWPRNTNWVFVQK